MTTTGDDAGNADDASVAYQINPLHTGSVSGRLRWPFNQLWTIDLHGQISYPLVISDTIYVTVAGKPIGEYGTLLYALEANTGGVLWGPVDLGGLYWFSGIAYDQGKVFAINKDALLRAFDARTGALAWSVQIDHRLSSRSLPAARDGFVYVAVDDQLYAINGVNGAILWKADISGTNNFGLVDGGSPVVTGDTVYISTHCQSSFAFDAATGAPIWRFDLAPECRAGLGGDYTSVIHEGLFYAPAKTGVEPIVIDAHTGSLVAAYYSADMPAFYDDLGYFLKEGALQAIDLRTGTTRWSFAGDGGLRSSPIIVSGMLFAPSETGKLYTVDAVSGSLLYVSTLPTSTLRYDGRNISIVSGMGAGSGKVVVPAGNWLVVFGNGDPVPTSTPTHTPIPTPGATRVAAPMLTSEPGDVAGATGGGSAMGILLGLAVGLAHNSSALLQPFFLPYLIAGTLALIFTIVTSWPAIKKRVALYGMIMWSALNVCGVTALIGGLSVGLVAYGFSTYATGGDASDQLAGELLSANGWVRVLTLLMVSGATMAGLGAAGGAILWLLLRDRFRRVPARSWVLANASFWPVTYTVSLFVGLVAALMFRGLTPAFVIAIGGIIGGLFAGGRVSVLATNEAVNERIPESESPDLRDTPELFQRLSNMSVPAQGGQISVGEMLMVRTRPAPRPLELPAFIVSMALIVAIAIIVVNVWVGVTSPRPRPAEESAIAAATATAVLHMPLIRGEVALAERFTQDANNYLAGGNKHLHDEYQRHAIEALDQVIALDPKYAPAYYGRAVAHEALGEYVLARSNLQRVLELAPDEELKLKAQRKLEELANR